MTSVSPGLGPDVENELRELRSLMAEFLAALPQPVSRAVDVEKQLALDKKLAWQVFRIARDPDPRTAGGRIPGPAATRRLLSAAKRAKLPSPLRERVDATTAKCRDLIESHARDRSTFELMVSAVTGDGLKVRNAELKRSAFRVNRQIYGKQCDATIFTLIIMPGTEPGLVHLASIRGQEGLCSYRPMSGLEISRHRFDHAGGEVQSRTRIDPDSPADSDRGTEPIALLESFSSQPFPPIRQVTGADGFVRSIAETTQLGHTKSMTFYLADVVHNSPLRGPSGDEAAAVGHIYEVATPSSLLFQDVLIHESLAVEPTLRVLRNRRDAGTWPGDDPIPLLPIQERVDNLGRGLTACHTPELPRYPELIGHACNRLGWDPDLLQLFRARIEHPVVDSVSWLRFDLSHLFDPD